MLSVLIHHSLLRSEAAAAGRTAAPIVQAAIPLATRALTEREYLRDTPA
jgi:hypothetical protein